METEKIPRLLAQLAIPAVVAQIINLLYNIVAVSYTHLVRIITPGIPAKKFIYNITRSFYHGLVKHGVRVYEWTPGFCHAKMSVADDCMATCGTINLDYRSLYHHFENGCFMADCQAVVEDVYKRQARYCHQYSP